MPDIQYPVGLRPETDVLTRGFDPSLSVGSARPAVFRSSTYVFSSPEAAERAFDIMGGRAQRTPEESVDLVYSRFNHPNAQILEDQIAPLEPGARAAAVFNSGMAAIMTTLLGGNEAGRQHHLHRSHLRRNPNLNPEFPSAVRNRGHPRSSRAD